MTQRVEISDVQLRSWRVTGHPYKLIAALIAEWAKDQERGTEAQARALTDLLAAYAITGQREILLAVDEFSAVSRRLPIWRLYERARSLGLAVQVTAQSWEGLGTDDDDRNRVAATAEGGI
jgi:hypothetical protein